MVRGLKCQFNKKITSDLNLKAIIYIGLFQTLALVPGVSRAGITITIARILKFNRYDSSKISFFLAIPALTGASILSLKDAIGQNYELNFLAVIAIILAFFLKTLQIIIYL